MSAYILLAEEDRIYRDLTTAILAKGGHSYTTANTPDEVRQAAATSKYDLALVDLAVLRQDRGLTAFLREQSGIPVILTTDEDVDHHFELIVDLKINLALSKPFKSQELLNLIDLLLHPDEKRWFGLENYLKNPYVMKRIELTNSLQIRNTIQTVFAQAEVWGFSFGMKLEMDLVWQEILTNALYHSHGYTKYKLERVPIRLPEPYRVLVRFAANEHQFGFSVRDFRGTLSAARILESLQISVEQQRMIEKAAESGEEISDKILDRGRGLDLIRRLTGEYYFVIDPGKSTEIIIIYDRNYEKDDPFSSIKILELPHSRSMGATGSAS